MTDKLFAVYYNLGLTAARNRHLEPAMQYLARALMIRPDSSDTWNLLGLCCYRLGQLGTAAVCWQNSLKISPFANRAESWLRECRQDQQILEAKLAQIRILSGKRQFRQAINIARQTRMGHESVASLILSGILKQLSGNLRGASMDWVQALELDRTHQQALSYLIDGQASRTGSKPTGWLKNPFRIIHPIRAGRREIIKEKDTDDQFI